MYVYIYICVRMYVCIYIYIYACIYTYGEREEKYTHIYRHTYI